VHLSETFQIRTVDLMKIWYPRQVSKTETQYNMVIRLGIEKFYHRLTWNNIPLPEIYMGAILIFTLTIWSNLFIWLHSTVTQLLEGLEAEEYFLSAATEDEISEWLNYASLSEIDDEEDFDDFFDDEDEDELDEEEEDDDDEEDDYEEDDEEDDDEVDWAWIYIYLIFQIAFKIKYEKRSLWDLNT